MIQRVVDTLGVVDSHGTSFRVAFEKLISHLDLEIRYQDRLHKVVARRLRSRPYDVLKAVSPYRAIMNRADRSSAHFNSYLMTVAPTTYLLNDIISFLAVDKNATYGHMTRLGLHIPPTAALPPQTDGGRPGEPPLPEQEIFDLREIGDEIGFPAWLKPQLGDQWGEAYRVEDAAALEAAWRRVGQRPMNLQREVETAELVYVIGVGPVTIPIHASPASAAEDRFIRGPERAIEHGFLSPEHFEEVSRITRICNAFFNWDHNACELVVDPRGVVHPIDFTNAPPDCSVLTLHYFFPDVVKAMVRWLVFNAVTQRPKPIFGHDWGRYFGLVDEAHREGWTYAERLAAFAGVADQHFDAGGFEAFCAEHLPDLDARALDYFASQGFQGLIEEEVLRRYKDGGARAARMRHHLGLHRFWLHCERDRLGQRT